MTYAVPESVAQANRGVMIMDVAGQFDHRGMVLREICELENVCAGLFIAFFQTRKSGLSETRVRKELFSENAMLSSLNRLVRLGLYLGLIEDDEAHDLRTLANLRNMYAHGRSRDQFYRDQEASAVLRSLKLMSASPALKELDDQGAFLSICQYLKQRMQERTAALRPAAV